MHRNISVHFFVINKNVKFEIMSLPSCAVFYLKGKEVKRLFVNCGWVLTREFAKSSIASALNMHSWTEKPFEWDKVSAYGEEFTKEEI